MVAQAAAMVDEEHLRGLSQLGRHLDQRPEHGPALLTGERDALRRGAVVGQRLVVEVRVAWLGAGSAPPVRPAAHLQPVDLVRLVHRVDVNPRLGEPHGDAELALILSEREVLRKAQAAHARVALA
jgi:hypothetical protein